MKTLTGTEENPVFVGLDLDIGDAVNGVISFSGDRTKPDNLTTLPTTEYWWGRGETGSNPPPNPYVLDEFGGAHAPGDPTVKDQTEHTY